MNWWYYEIIVDGKCLAKDIGYETQIDAEMFGVKQAKQMGLREYEIATGQEWEDI